jgi:HTH domain/T5orf172 domain
LSELIPFAEIAKKLGISDRTIRRTIAKIGGELGLTIQRKSRSSPALCLSVDDTNKLLRYFEERDEHVGLAEESENVGSYSGYGYFYIVQLIPEALPNRVKIGYTDNLVTRLKEHQTSAPTAKYLGHWECKRAWDLAVMDSITRKDCTLVMNEVYEGDIDLFLVRAAEFFGVMPNSSTVVELAEHSPLRNDTQ